MIVFLPWRLEFGTMIMHWVRHVRQEIENLPRGVKTVVCCRRGDEQLFPGADQYFYDWEDLPDTRKKWSTAKAGDHREYMEHLEAELANLYPGAKLIHPPRRFPPDQSAWNFRPRLRVSYDFGPQRADVLLAPRYREHGAHRNYQHWQAVCDGLQAAGYRVGLIGMKSTSLDLQGVDEQLKAWNYEDNLNVTFILMGRARLTITTDSGMAHLAVLNQSPLKVIYDQPGKEAGHPTWPWAFDHMKTHAVAHCEPVLYGWDSPDTVVASAIDYLRETPDGT